MSRELLDRDRRIVEGGPRDRARAPFAPARVVGVVGGAVGRDRRDVPPIGPVSAAGTPVVEPRGSRHLSRHLAKLTGVLRMDDPHPTAAPDESDGYVGVVADAEVRARSPVPVVAPR